MDLQQPQYNYVPEPTYLRGIESPYPPPTASTRPKMGKVAAVSAVLLVVVALAVMWSLSIVDHFAQADQAASVALSSIGNGVNADGDTPYTNSKYAISAVLPGSNWDMPVEFDNSMGEDVLRFDGMANFAYFVYPPAYTPSEWVADHKAASQYQPLSITNTTYQGYPAIRFETLLDLKKARLWHDVYYVFSANRVTYAVKAGTRIELWDTSGKTLVSKLLDSVTIMHKEATLDPGQTPAPTAAP